MDPLSQLLFIGLWNLADRRGFIEYRPLRIKAEIFPYRELDIYQVIDPLIGEHIRIVKIDDKEYIHVINLTKHQVFNIRENESTVPEQYWNNTDTVPAHWEGKGREGKGEGARAPAREGHTPSSFSKEKISFAKTEELLEKDEAWKSGIMEEFNFSAEDLITTLKSFLHDTKLSGKYPRQLSDTQSHFVNCLKAGKYGPVINPSVYPGEF